MAVWGLVALGAVTACGDHSAPSPFEAPEADAGSDATLYADSSATAPDGQTEPDPTLGGPCLDDGQCDDGIDCTFDACDLALERCRFTPDDLQCDDGVFCNGAEVCAPAVGCRAGPVVACSDGTACTIDSCNEEDHSCTHEPRDGDGDGDPDINCGGGDCNEREPRISSLSVEVCGNGVDDDCDGDVDEALDCASPQYDDCVEALEISASGSYELSPVAAQPDVSAACVVSKEGATRDLIAALIVPDGPPVQIDVVLTAQSGTLALATANVCGEASADVPCATSVRTSTSTSLARLIIRDLGPGAYPLYLFTDADATLTLKVEFETPEPRAPNETCGTAIPIEPGTHVQGSLADALGDVPTACDADVGDLVYEFTLTEAQDVRLLAASLDGYGVPSVSLRSAACARADDEIVCRSAENDEVYWRALPAGQYFVAVSATGPTDFDLLLSTSAPTTPPPDESCISAPALSPGTEQSITFDNHVDDIDLGCSVGLPDAAYSLNLDERSDVLLIERIASADSGVLAFADAQCSEASAVCATGADSPLHLALRDLDPGSYRAVVETEEGGPATFSALVRPAQAPILVAFADTCASAIEVPAGGALLTGNTGNARADYDAGCDLGGGAAGGAPDQMLRLNLPARKRVVLDAEGSRYSTIVDVRRGPDCPGQEVAFGCSAASASTPSYLDLVLDAGQYFVQIDGYAGAKGPWFLDVYIIDP